MGENRKRALTLCSQPSAPTQTPPLASESSFGALSAPKPDDTEKTIRKTERALTFCFRPRGSPNATARVRIKFRRPERAQIIAHTDLNEQWGKSEAGTHSLFPTIRADPNDTARVRIKFRRPERAQTKGKRKRALTGCFRPHRRPESHRPCQYSFSAR